MRIDNEQEKQMNDRPPVLNDKLRKEIEARLQVVGGVDPFAGDPQSEGFQRVLTICHNAWAESKKIQAKFMGRLDVAARSRRTEMMVAAVYGMQVDMTGRIPPGQIDEAFNSLIMRSMRYVSSGDIQKWLDQQQGITANATARRALVEYLDERLAELDALVAVAYPEKNEADAGEAAPEPEAVPRM